ncbi:MAG: single-stranded DNA-binding protein [Anaerovoracaceae bacterium]
MQNGLETNQLELRGTIETMPEYSHKSYGEVFYCFTLAVERKSGYRDQLQVMVSERLIWNLDIKTDIKAYISGQIRTYNQIIDGKNKLNIVAFAREISLLEEEEEETVLDENKVYLEGYLCKLPVYRVSPLGREICDMMLAVNRMYNKSDYIPCIAWGRNASYAESLKVGTRIRISGRFQSREYRKKDEEGNVTIKVAYEVSIVKIED